MNTMTCKTMYCFYLFTVKFALILRSFISYPKIHLISLTQILLMIYGEMLLKKIVLNIFYYVQQYTMYLVYSLV